MPAGEHQANAASFQFRNDVLRTLGDDVHERIDDLGDVVAHGSAEDDSRFSTRAVNSHFPDRSAADAHILMRHSSVPDLERLGCCSEEVESLDDATCRNDGRTLHVTDAAGR